MEDDTTIWQRNVDVCEGPSVAQNVEQEIDKAQLQVEEKNVFKNLL